jgi:hypothetical protein
MPHSASITHWELLPHLVVLGAMIVFTVVLALWPQSILHVGYQCQLRALLGLRCPFCGMTRDFATMLHGGRPTLNPCSWFAALVVYGVYPAAVALAWRRKRLDVFHSASVARMVAVALAAMLVLNNLP